MKAFSLHPNVYALGNLPNLFRMLEEVWVRNHTPGDGTLYIISGFGTYNGGVRFYEVFKQHISRGGKVVSFFAGSTSQRLTSKQLVKQLLELGVEVNVINRKRLLHAKCYGSTVKTGDFLIVTSGNFTGPGMSQNVEAAVLLDYNDTQRIGFSWTDVVTNLKQQRWDTRQPILGNAADPAWQLLYDEQVRDLVQEEEDELTLIMTLGHADTVRVRAQRGTNAAKGTPYFWLSKDSTGFFPPLTIRNRRGHKATFSCKIKLHFIDIRMTVDDNRVTFEAENNFDFRLGTGPLRATQLADVDDLMALSRTSEREYELRIFKQNDPHYLSLLPYAVSFIGHRGKKYGYIENESFTKLTGIRLPSVSASGF